MKIKELFKTKECIFALEVFPPRKQSGIENLYASLQNMKAIAPDYISVTYSAGGSGVKEYTSKIAAHLKQNLQIEPLAHLTCINSGSKEVNQELTTLQKDGISNILALRGDRKPDGSENGFFSHASDLASHIQKFGDFYIAGACYPEGHPESPSLVADIENLKIKADSGVGHLISQLFFDNGKFFRFLNLVRKKGIHCPIEAGIMPVVRKEQIERTISLSSASLPSEFSKMVSRYADDEEAFYSAGIDYAIRQIRDLIESGVDGIHLYAMNNAEVARRVKEGIADLL